jgi:hypothetical protein
MYVTQPDQTIWSFHFSCRNSNFFQISSTTSLDTDINQSNAPYFLPSNNIVVGNHSATIPLDREFEISGELCPLQLSWYVMSSWKFEVGGGGVSAAEE